MVSTVVFIDSRIADKDRLVSLLPADSRHYVLEKERDGIDQMLSALSGSGNLDSIHLITHGAPGSIIIGSTVLESTSLLDYSQELTAIGSYLREGGDLLLYGCYVGAGRSGISFIRELAIATGADVAASDNATGSAPAGGDWRLEVSTGSVDTADLFAVDTYPELLGTTVPGLSEFLVNTCTAAAQSTPVLATLADGKVAITWTSSAQDGSGNGVYGQLYTPASLTEGIEFLINTRTANNQQNPAIAALADGGFIVTWQSYLQDGKSYGIYGQRYDASGQKSGTEFRVNTYIESSQSAPAVTGLDQGGFVIIWQSDGQDGDSTGIYAQRYDASGIATGSEFRVNTWTVGAQSLPSATALDGGGFAVAWQSDGQDSDSAGIYLQRYDASGMAISSETQVNTHTAYAQSVPAIASLHNGGFVVAWQSDKQDGSNWGVYARCYDAGGSALGDEILVNTHKTYTQSAPAIGSLSGGGFVVVWNSSSQDGDGYGIYGQRFLASGVPSGGEFTINSFVTGDQSEPSVTALDDGGFMVAWQSKEQDSSDWGIYARRFDASGNPVLVGNNSPTGDILIHGLVRSGETLTADTSTLTDADGLGPFSYQWYADNSAISEATGSSYTITRTEIGKAISVRVSYTDGNGSPEQVMSDATDPVTYSALKLTGVRTASGLDVQIWLTAHTVIDIMDLEFSYRSEQATWSGYVTSLEQWELLAAEPVAGTIALAGFASTFTPLDSNTDLLIGTFSFSFSDEEPDFAIRVTDYSALGNSMTVPDEVDPGTLPEINAPEVTGTIPDQSTAEDTLYSYAPDQGLFEDQDSVNGDRLVYSASLADGSALPSWLHFDANSCTFSGTPQNQDVGTLAVRIQCTDQSGLSTSDYFTLFITNTNDAPIVTTPIPDIAVTEKNAFVLTIADSSFTDADAGDLVTLSATLSDGSTLPSWLHFDTATCTFSGTPANQDVGTLSVRVHASDLHGASEDDTFVITVNNVNDPPQGSVSIEGLPIQGQTVTANTDSLTDADGVGVFSYQWYADGSAITDANGRSVTLTEAQVGRSISVAVSYNDGHGSQEQLFSSATISVANINDHPVGNPLISGVARQGETLTVDVSGISDADGISGSFDYQWYSGSTPIPGATSATHLLTADDLCKTISASVTWIDGHGTTELLQSQPTHPVLWPGSMLGGEIAYWKNGATLSDVILELSSADTASESGTTVSFGPTVLHADGSRSIEVWAHSPVSFESLQLDWVLPEGSSATWTNATAIPAGWSLLAAAVNEREFRLSGFGLNSFAAGTVRLGTLTLSAPDNPDRFDLALVSGELGATTIAPFNTTWAQQQSDAGGHYRFNELTDGIYSITADRTPDSSAANAITAADALATLKIAIGLNPNANGNTVSNYQYLAADIDHDGQIRATDALGILKMAVGMITAPSEEWLFVSNSILTVEMNRKSVDWQAVQTGFSLTEDMDIDLIGILKGDVNGSWVEA